LLCTAPTASTLAERMSRVRRRWDRSCGSRSAGSVRRMLKLRGHLELPPHAAGGFDHGDVHLATGRVFVAHTAKGTIEVIDGGRHEHTIPGCPEGSGVLCTQGDDALVFVAARGAGKVLVLDPRSFELRNEVVVGPKPNGLAFDPTRGHVLVADVEDYRARLIDPVTGTTLASVELPGRPRWCVYDRARDRFLVNIREPACVVALAGGTAAMQVAIGISAAGPHGLDIDHGADRAYVACDSGEVVVVDLTRDQEIGSVPIGGEPDAIWFNPQRQELYVAIGDPGLLEVLDCRRLTISERLNTERGAHTTAFDVRRQLVYVFLPRTSRAAVFEVSNS
jgi:DNA-binding beta-propeller fold protein YncE